MMSARKFVLGLVCLVSLAGCSSDEKKSESPGGSSKASVDLKSTANNDDIVQKYSISELNAAATALRAIADAGVSKPADDRGTEIIGCAMSSRQALSMTMPIKALIDSSQRAERDAYALNPKSYSSEKAFESCASTCSCGLFSDIVESAADAALPQGSAKIHARNKQRLTAKAAHQSAGDTLACAKKAAWFCGSDLKSYLEKESRQNAE